MATKIKLGIKPPNYTLASAPLARGFSLVAINERVWCFCALKNSDTQAFVAAVVLIFFTTNLGHFPQEKPGVGYRHMMLACNDMLICQSYYSFICLVPMTWLISIILASFLKWRFRWNLHELTQHVFISLPIYLWMMLTMVTVMFWLDVCCKCFSRSFFARSWSSSSSTRELATCGVQCPRQDVQLLGLIFLIMNPSTRWSRTRWTYWAALDLGFSAMMGYVLFMLFMRGWLFRTFVDTHTFAISISIITSAGHVYILCISSCWWCLLSIFRKKNEQFQKHGSYNSKSNGSSVRSGLRSG